jgi:iron-sulfur cluster assembly accessory protein
MIKVSKTAAEQIIESAKQGQMEGMPLRLAAVKQEDGSLHYNMGFADRQMDDDVSFDSEGVKIVVSAANYDLLKNTELDFVELDNGEMNFIFKNPNDPNYQPPEESSEHHF